MSIYYTLKHISNKNDFIHKSKTQKSNGEINPDKYRLAGAAHAIWKNIISKQNSIYQQITNSAGHSKPLT